MLRSTPFEIAASEARERLSQVRAANGNDPRAGQRGSTYPVILAVHQHAGTDRGGDRSAKPRQYKNSVPYLAAHGKCSRSRPLNRTKSSLVVRNVVRCTIDVNCPAAYDVGK